MKLGIGIIITILLYMDAAAQHSLKKLAYPINTDVYDEICPILSYDESELYYTKVGFPDFDRTLIENDRPLHLQLSEEAYMRKLSHIYSLIAGHKEDAVSSTFNQDVWYSDYHEGEVLNYIHPLPPLNNALPNSICSHYGKSGGYVVINQFPEGGGVSAGFSIVHKIDNLHFTTPQPITIMDFELAGSEINVSMSADKQYIIMAMAGPGSMGKKDLYLSIKGAQDDIYGSPVNLGHLLNTPYNEATPFFSQDKKKLYFSSDRPGGYGGMDIYVSDRLDYSFRKWSEPRLIGRPINSSADDSHPYVAINEDDILFTSNRDGSSDIFFAKLVRDDTLAHHIDVNVYIVKGEKREKVNRAGLYWGPAYEDDYPHFFNTRGGSYKHTVTENEVLKFKAEARGMMSDVVILDPQEMIIEGVTSIDIELVLENNEGRPTVFKRTFIENKKKEEDKLANSDDLLPLEVNSTVVLKNIYFARAKPDVLPRSFPSLQKLAEVMKRRPEVVIQIEGHTDNVGGKEALEKLSYQRAEAIADYLIKAGVSTTQIKTKGFGDSRPITANRTEEERSKNRRVEIRVLKQTDK